MKWNDRPGGVHGQYFLKDGIWRRFQMDVLVHQVIGIPAIFSGNVQVWLFTIFMILSRNLHL
jgi:hypothetical protein